MFGRRWKFWKKSKPKDNAAPASGPAEAATGAGAGAATPDAAGTAPEALSAPEPEPEPEPSAAGGGNGAQATGAGDSDGKGDASNSLSSPERIESRPEALRSVKRNNPLFAQGSTRSDRAGTPKMSTLAASTTTPAATILDFDSVTSAPRLNNAHSMAKRNVSIHQSKRRPITRPSRRTPKQGSSDPAKSTPVDADAGSAAAAEDTYSRSSSLAKPLFGGPMTFSSNPQVRVHSSASEEAGGDGDGSNGRTDAPDVAPADGSGEDDTDSADAPAGIERTSSSKRKKEKEGNLGAPAGKSNAGARRLSTNIALELNSILGGMGKKGGRGFMGGPGGSPEVGGNKALSKFANGAREVAEPDGPPDAAGAAEVTATQQQPEGPTDGGDKGVPAAATAAAGVENGAGVPPANAAEGDANGRGGRSPRDLRKERKGSVPTFNVNVLSEMHARLKVSPRTERKELGPAAGGNEAGAATAAGVPGDSAGLESKEQGAPAVQVELEVADGAGATESVAAPKENAADAAADAGAPAHPGVKKQRQSASSVKNWVRNPTQRTAAGLAFIEQMRTVHRGSGDDALAPVDEATPGDVYAVAVEPEDVAALIDPSRPGPAAAPAGVGTDGGTSGGEAGAEAGGDAADVAATPPAHTPPAASALEEPKSSLSALEEMAAENINIEKESSSTSRKKLLKSKKQTRSRVFEEDADLGLLSDEAAALKLEAERKQKARKVEAERAAAALEVQNAHSRFMKGRPLSMMPEADEEGENE